MAELAGGEGAARAHAAGVEAGDAAGADGPGCVRVWVSRGQRLCLLESGDVIVLEESVIDDGVDWNARRDAERGVDRRRAGAPVNEAYPEGGVGAVLSRRRGGRAPRGRGARPRRPPAPAGERRRNRAYDCLHEAAARLGRRSPEDPLLQTAGHILALALKSLGGRRLTREQECALAAWSIHKAVQVHNLPIPMNAILEAARVTDSAYWSVHKSISWSREVASRIGLMMHAGRGGRLDGDGFVRVLRDGGVSCAGRVFPRIAAFIEKGTVALGLPVKFSHAATKLLADILIAGGKDLCGRHPESVAAAAIYLASHVFNYRPLSQKEAAKALGVKEAALRKQYRFLLSGVTLIVYL